MQSDSLIDLICAERIEDNLHRSDFQNGINWMIDRAIVLHDKCSKAMSHPSIETAYSLLKELRDTTPITAQRKRIDAFLVVNHDVQREIWDVALIDKIANRLRDWPKHVGAGFMAEQVYELICHHPKPEPVFVEEFSLVADDEYLCPVCSAQIGINTQTCYMCGIAIDREYHCRKAFDEWRPNAASRDSDGTYFSADKNNMWLAWKTAWNADRKQPRAIDGATTKTVWDIMWDFLDCRKGADDHAVAASALRWIDEKYRKLETIDSAELREDIDAILSACRRGEGVAGRLQGVITKIDRGFYAG